MAGSSRQKRAIDRDLRDRNGRLTDPLDDQLAAIRAARNRCYKQQLEGQLLAHQAAQRRRYEQQSDGQLLRAASHRHWDQQQETGGIEYHPYGVVVVRRMFGPERRRDLVDAIVAVNRNEVHQRHPGNYWIHFTKRDQLGRFADAVRPVWTSFIQEKVRESAWKRSTGIDPTDAFPTGLLFGYLQVTANIFQCARDELDFHVDYIGNDRQYNSDWLLNVNFGVPGCFEYYNPKKDSPRHPHTLQLNDGDAILFDGNHLMHRVHLVDAPPVAYMPPWKNCPTLRFSLQFRSAEKSCGPNSLTYG